MIKKLTVLLMLFFLTSCFTTTVVKKPAPFAELNPVMLDETEEPYRIGVGDELQLSFFFAPKMDETVKVRPDGKISVMFAGDVKVAGRTPQQLTKIIRKKLRGHVKQTDLLVTVSNFGSQRVYVGGEVTKPGPVQLSKRSSIMQVLGEVGWATPLATTTEIIIVRRETGKRAAVYHVNLGDAISGEDMGQDVMVRPGDVILVPPSGPVDFDRWMDQHIRQAIPFGASVSYNYTNYYNGVPR